MASQLSLDKICMQFCSKSLGRRGRRCQFENYSQTYHFLCEGFSHSFLQMDEWVKTEDKSIQKTLKINFLKINENYLMN